MGHSFVVHSLEKSGFGWWSQPIDATLYLKKDEMERSSDFITPSSLPQ